jgi:hypothetical protein
VTSSSSRRRRDHTRTRPYFFHLFFLFVSKTDISLPSFACRGVAELSSVPLVLVDICKYYPEVQRR